MTFLSLLGPASSAIAAIAMTQAAVQAAIEAGQLEGRRLKNYLKLQSEQARNSASLAERRGKDRQQGQLYKRIISEKQKRRHGN